MLKKIDVRHEVISIRELSPDLVKAWDSFQDRDCDLVSPFFSHGFARAVGRHRPDLRVAVLKTEGRVSGFLPFHLRPGGCAAPVGGQICDYQGIIGTAPGAGLRGGQLLQGCGLVSYDFNHGLANQSLLKGNAFRFSQSLGADLRQGLDGWQADVDAGTKRRRKLLRDERKIQRDIGPLRFLAHDTSEEAWQQFRIWKDLSLRRQGAGGFNLPAWAEALFSDLRATDSPRFAGQFSTLYAGDRLVAAHFGIRSHMAWHWWFPAYDAELRALSPGLILTVKCIEEAARRGMAELDFGGGTQQYKQRFSNRSRPLCEGSLERPLAPFGAARAARKSMQRLANRTLPAKSADILRRGGTKVLRAGLI